MFQEQIHVDLGPKQTISYQYGECGFRTYNKWYQSWPPDLASYGRTKSGGGGPQVACDGSVMLALEAGNAPDLHVRCVIPSAVERSNLDGVSFLALKDG